MALIDPQHRALVDAYFDGWNAHDADAVTRTFAAEGTYEDPTTGGPVPRAHIEHVVAALCAAFPDLSFERGEAIGEGPCAATTSARPAAACSPRGRR